MFVTHMVINTKGDTMKFLSDKPIESKEQDLLHRAEYAKRFAKNLVTLTQVNSFTVSLNGCWGSGKTSLINLIKNEIYNLQNYDDEIEYFPVILDFAPWNTLEENVIIKQFFDSFSSVFTKTKIKQLLKDKRTKLALKIIEELPYIGKNIRELHNLFNSYFKGFLGEDGDLLETKKKITRNLEKSKFKYIVFIDDIDRLNNKEIRLLIQLIKAVCNFPNVVYVLAFDKTIVADALKEEQSIDGYAYLEKIIQLSVDIPEIETDDLQQYLLQKIESVIGNVDENDFNVNRWSYIFRKGFANYFKTLRDVNRYINSIQFKFANYCKVIDIIDFLTMEAISLFEPRLLQLLLNYRGLLCGESLFGNKDVEAKKFKTKVENISINYQMLVVLFPALDNEHITNFHGESKNFYYLKSRGRICFIDNFDYYFAGQLNRNSISKDDVKKMLYCNTREDNNEYFSRLNNRSYNTLLQFLFGLSQDKTHIERIALFLPELMEYNIKFKNLTGFLVLDNSHWIDGIIDKIYKSFGKEKMLEYLSNLYKSSNDYGTLIDNIYSNARGTDFYFKNDKEDSNFSIEEIEILHKILIERLKKEMAKPESIEIPNFIQILYFIEKKNRDVLQEWYNTQSSNLLNIVDKLVNSGYGESSVRFRTYNFCHDVFDEFVDVELIKKKVRIFVSSSDDLSDNPEQLLGKILFLMPVRKDDAYVLSDIMGFCQANSIKFSYADSFTDE